MYNLRKNSSWIAYQKDENKFFGLFGSGAEISTLPATLDSYAVDTSTGFIWQVQNGVWVDTQTYFKEVFDSYKGTMFANGVGEVGKNLKYSMEDHQHPTDNTKEPVIVKNTAFNSNFCNNTASVSEDGIAYVGLEDEIIKADHVHPLDNSKVNLDGYNFTATNISTSAANNVASKLSQSTFLGISQSTLDELLSKAYFNNLNATGKRNLRAIRLGYNGMSNATSSNWSYTCKISGSTITKTGSEVFIPSNKKGIFKISGSWSLSGTNTTTAYLNLTYSGGGYSTGTNLYKLTGISGSINISDYDTLNSPSNYDRFIFAISTQPTNTTVSLNLNVTAYFYI
jgi:hypothetical protein